MPVAKAPAANRDAVAALGQNVIDAAIIWQQAPDVAVAMGACRKLDAVVREYLTATKPVAEEEVTSRWSPKVNADG